MQKTRISRKKYEKLARVYQYVRKQWFASEACSKDSMGWIKAMELLKEHTALQIMQDASGKWVI